MLDSSSMGMGMGFDKVESGEQVIRQKLGVSMANKKRKFKHLNSVQPKEAVDKISSRSKKHKQSKEEEEEEEEAESGYVHVRARRGQATDSHSLAERVRREKISERMKMLQSLVPACEKVAGKALMLDEIINYVQSMQNQVQFLSKKLGYFTPIFVDSSSLKPPPPHNHHQQQEEGNPRELVMNNSLGSGTPNIHNYDPMMMVELAYQLPHTIPAPAPAPAPALALLHHHHHHQNNNGGGQVMWEDVEEDESGQSCLNNQCGGLLNNFHSS